MIPSRKVLFYAPILEYPAAGGPQISVVNALKALSAHAEIRIVTTVPKFVRKRETDVFFSQYAKLGIVDAPSCRFQHVNPKVNKLLGVFRRFFPALLVYLNVIKVARECRKLDINVVWVDRVLEFAFPFFKALRRRSGLQLVADTCSVFSRFILRELDYCKDERRRQEIQKRGTIKQVEECFILGQADVVTAVSEIDAECFRSMTTMPNRVMLFSNVIDVEDYKQIVPHYSKEQRPIILLIGSYGHVHSPMDRAAQRMLEGIMPAIWQQRPDAELWIVGRNSDRLWGSYDGKGQVRVFGQVESMLPFLEAASIVAVPLDFESGTRFKILEAGASGVAVVSTCLGAEGIAVTNQKDILLAEEDGEFVDACLRILGSNEFGKKLGDSLKILITERYSIKAQSQEADQILRFLESDRS